MQQKNLLIFLVLFTVLFLGYSFLRVKLFPPPPKPPAPVKLSDDRLWWVTMPPQVQGLLAQAPGVPVAGNVSGLATALASTQLAAGAPVGKAPPEPELSPIPLPEPKLWATLPAVLQGFAATAPTGAAAGNIGRLASAAGIAHWSSTFPEPVSGVAAAPHRVIQLGDDRSFLKVLLTSRGAGVENLVCTRFAEANELGRPAGDPPPPLNLIPDDPNRPSFRLYHYAQPVTPEASPDDPPSPLDTLGRMDWAAPEQATVREDGTQEVSFTAEAPGQEVTITKTYTLAPGDYHLGLTVKMERKKSAAGPLPFRYQLAGAHGLPIEGVWYTTVYRNALVGRIDAKGHFLFDLQDAGKIGYQAGGNAVERDENYIQYAGIATQYFASVAVLDDQPEPGVKLDFEQKRNQLAWARPTVEGEPFPTQQFRDDITMRLVAGVVTLKPGVPVVHRYLLYNGPIKVRLLGQLEGDAAVASEKVAFYETKLGLATLTDHRSSSFTFFETIGWTDLLIKCTNIMHSFLWYLHKVIPNYGLCIIILTVLVRGAMFPLSRRQAISSARVQEKMKELAPEVKKLEEKHKGDQMAFHQARNELYMKRGVHVGAMMGSCWVVVLQMPIFLGLYYALQESIHFRLAPFLWMKNLAAPDMLFYWSDKIYYISRWEDLHSSWVYLGPFFNLLPIIAVAFMIVQQKLLTPPPTDEQQEMQQKMMKYMMVFFGFMFYKVAAGLCLYFIASSLWGLTERKVLLRKVVAGPGVAGVAAVPAKPAGGGGPSRSRQRGQPREKEKEANGTLQKMRELWEKVLREARKK